MISKESRSAALTAMSKVALRYRSSLSAPCLEAMLDAALNSVTNEKALSPTGLTRRQTDARDFIRRYAAENDGVSPSFDDIRAGLGLKSRSSVSRLVTELEQRGAIKRISGFGRNIVLAEPKIRKVTKS